MTELVDLFVERASERGFTVIRGGTRPALATDDVEFSVASFGIASTGSVVLVASPGEPRSRSLLPAAHVSLLDPTRIVETLSDLFAEVGKDLPSALAIVSGPSQSGDIEQRHMVGVHGPGAVYVVLTDESEEDPHA